MMLPLLLLGSTFTEARFSNIKKMLPEDSLTGKQLKEYGCHCWRKTDDGKRQVGFGVGIPIMDPIDQACYDLSACYAVANEMYGVDIGARYKWTTDESGQIDCSRSRKPGNAALCTCDAEFVNKIVGDGDRRRTGRPAFHGESNGLHTVFDNNFWGNKKNLKLDDVEWNPKETCVADSPDAEERFCSSRHVQRCFNQCAGCFLLRELGSCLVEPSGCGSCDGCSFTGGSQERCLDAERCWADFHCNNGVKDASEQGVDCGGSCSTSCAQAGDMTPFCELIRYDGACSQNCVYAFSDPKFINADPPIMPDSLIIDICTTPEGKYTNLCPDQCACENQRNQPRCDKAGHCTWEPDTSVAEHLQIFTGSCIANEA